MSAEDHASKAVAASGQVRIGVDLGGSKIEAVALEGRDRELARSRVPAPQDDYDGTLSAIAGLVQELEARIGRQGTIGVGIPGTISPSTGLVKNANSVWLIGRPLDRDLGTLLGRPVRVANDANCFALSEQLGGAANGATLAFGVILGTGVGGGVVVEGRVLTGVNAISGEWGHNPLPWPRDDERPGPECYCGRRGCIETFLSGPGLARDYIASGGEALTAADIAAAAEAGEVAAANSLARYEDRLARGLASVINILDPEIIVLGGGLSNIERLRLNVPRLWVRYVFSDRVDTALVAARFGDSSGVRGAAWLWPEAEA